MRSLAGRGAVTVQRIPMPVLLLSISLVSACDATGPSSAFVAGPLGAVSVGAQEAVQIRTLLSVTGAPELGVVARRGVELAVEDLGPVGGRDIELGGALDAMCSPEGGRAGADQIAGNEQVVGVVGTICSAAAVAASPAISEAGLVMISTANTSPLLTFGPGGQRPGAPPRRLLPGLEQRSPPGDRALRLRVQPARVETRGHRSRRRPVYVRPRGSVRRRVPGCRRRGAGDGRGPKGPDRHGFRVGGACGGRPGRDLLPALSGRRLRLCRTGPRLRSSRGCHAHLGLGAAGFRTLRRTAVGGRVLRGTRNRTTAPT